MSVDYQVLLFQDAAPIKSVGLYSEDPPTLDIKGTNFADVSTVLINGALSPEFITLSARRVLAEIPRSERSARIRSVSVLLKKTNVTGRSSISFRAVVPGARATGFTRLLQSYLRLLFTNPGDDLANPDEGGGLYQLVGASGDQGALRAVAASAVKRAEESMIRLQTSNDLLEDSERLQSVSLLSAEYNPSSTSVAIQIRLTAMDGTTHQPVVSV